jgi:F420-0:gamma-glutamyl ligase
LDQIQFNNGDIIFITSKVLAIHQGRCIPTDDIDKQELVKKEASYYLPCPDFNNVALTITNNLLIVNAGIDESNTNGHYVLLPNNINNLLTEISDYILLKNNLHHIGVVSSDSRTQPICMINQYIDWNELSLFLDTWNQLGWLC